MRNRYTTSRSSSYLLQLEKACIQQWKPSATKKKKESALLNFSNILDGNLIFFSLFLVFLNRILSIEYTSNFYNSGLLVFYAVVMFQEEKLVKGMSMSFGVKQSLQWPPPSFAVPGVSWGHLLFSFNVFLIYSGLRNQTVKFIRNICELHINSV